MNGGKIDHAAARIALRTLRDDVALACRLEEILGRGHHESVERLACLIAGRAVAKAESWALQSGATQAEVIAERVGARRNYRSIIEQLRAFSPDLYGTEGPTTSQSAAGGGR